MHTVFFLGTKYLSAKFHANQSVNKAETVLQSHKQTNAKLNLIPRFAQSISYINTHNQLNPVYRTPYMQAYFLTDFSLSLLSLLTRSLGN